MMSESEIDASLKEALRSVERAIGGINTIHIGPLDHNIRTTVDDLLVAIRLLEQVGRDTQDIQIEWPP